MPQMTLLTGPERRRRWNEEDRRRVLAAAFSPGAVVADVARRFDVATSLIYKWRRAYLTLSGFASAVVVDAPALSASEPQLLERLREWWREGRRLGALLPGGWLFPGRNPMLLRVEQGEAASCAAACASTPAS